MDGSRVALIGLTILVGMCGSGGCYDPHPAEGAPCNNDDECISPQRCVLHMCSARCDGARTPDNAQIACKNWGGLLGEIHDMTGQMCARDLVIADRTTFGLRQSDTATLRGDGWTWNPIAPNPGT